MELEETRAARLYLTNGRVPRPPRKNQRNIPFEAEQLLYRFTYGSQTPPRGQSDSFLSPNQHWDCLNTTPRTALSSRRSRQSSAVKSRTIEDLTTPNSHSTTRQSSTQSPFLVSSTPPRPASKPFTTVDNTASLPPNRPSSSSSTTSANAKAKSSAKPSTKSSSKSNLSPSPIPRPSVEAPRRAARDDLRKTATVGNANHQQASTSRLEKPCDRLLSTTQRRVRRLHEQESSPEYESSRSSSKSPEPNPQDSPPRRSGRARKNPVTYNVRALVGLELEQTRPTGSVSEGGTDSGRSSPQPTDSPLITSVSVPPQAPQITDNKSSRAAPNVERVLRDRQQGRFKSNGYYNRAYADSLSDLRPWRTWKGASNDVICLAWSPDGICFAAGATSHGGDYNRGNNLVFGDLTRNSLRELPDHWEPRPGALSTQDQWLFSTISATQWVGEHLYTASFDKTVKIWDVGEGTPRPKKTLQHDAPVEVMAVSKHLPNKLATGTKEGFWLWNLGSMVSYEKLGIVRYSGQKNVDLSPTNLIWGNTPETKNLLVGGMVQRTDDVEDLHVARYGHLSMWKVDESAVNTIKLSPDSQNIFDIKWHPSMPIFGTASSMRDRKSYPPGSESLVNLYTYLPSSNKAIHSHSFPCPAVDINEITFCPIGSNHVTASCTDGSTYVWDTRFPNTILHKLQHGNPLLPISHDVRREYADVGVRVALWGSSIDQFYTGGSDGCIKQWDIRRATEDALVTDVANLNDAVMSAVFSPDKANLLVGDNGCGIHVLSSGPCGDPETAPFDFEYAPSTPLVSFGHHDRDQVQENPEPAGVAAARELLASCQLTMDPLYGPVQGPKYAGPYARWSRNIPPDAPDTQVSQAPFLEECQLRQFRGPAVRDRNGLDENSKQELQQVFNLAHACNGRRGSQSTGLSMLEKTAPASAPPTFEPTGIREFLPKRKRGGSHISISGDEDTPPLKKNKGSTLNANQDEPVTSLQHSEVIVISDDEECHPSDPAISARVKSPLLSSTTTYKMEEPEQSSQGSLDIGSDAETAGTPEDLFEDDHWWPDSRHVDANISRRRTDG